MAGKFAPCADHALLNQAQTVMTLAGAHPATAAGNAIFEKLSICTTRFDGQLLEEEARARAPDGRKCVFDDRT